MRGGPVGTQGRGRRGTPRRGRTLREDRPAATG